MIAFETASREQISPDESSGARGLAPMTDRKSPDKLSLANRLREIGQSEPTTGELI